MSEISITVNGNVATDPKHVVGVSGKPRTTFRLASTARKRQGDGSYVDGATSFLNVTCFDTLAINAAACVAKGHPVVVTGTLTVRDWEADGRSGREADLVARTLGHDLRWGQAAFARPARSRTSEPAAVFEPPVFEPPVFEPAAREPAAREPAA